MMAFHELPHVGGGTRKRGVKKFCKDIAPAFRPKRDGMTTKELKAARRKHNRNMRRAVYDGKYKMTRGGLTKKDLTVSYKGTIVSKKRALHGRRMMCLYRDKMEKHQFKKRNGNCNG